MSLLRLAGGHDWAMDFGDYGSVHCADRVAGCTPVGVTPIGVHRIVVSELHGVGKVISVLFVEHLWVKSVQRTKHFWVV